MTMKRTPEQEEDLRRMKGLSLAVLAAIFTLLLILGVVIDCHGQEIASKYVVPVVVRARGEAGTVWRTELCITHPQWYPLMVRIEAWQDGAMVGNAWTIPPNQTWCVDDFYQEVFVAQKAHAGVILVATPEDNPVLEHLQFTPSIRVYNLTDEGQYGVEVPAIPVTFGREDPYGFAYAWAQASGVLQWGEPLEDGFRAAWGVFNVDRHPRDLHVYVREWNGNVQWEDEVEVPGLSQRQYPFPDWVSLRDGGSITLEDDAFPADKPPLYGYVTVTDNVTGDGVYRPMTTVHEFQFGEVGDE